MGELGPQTNIGSLVLRSLVVQLPLIGPVPGCDGAFVATFSAKGATGQGILEAAREDYRGLIEANAGFLNLQGEDENQKRSA